MYKKFYNVKLTFKILAQYWGTQKLDQQELHISSMVVHARPEHLAGVKKGIEQMPGAEIHGESDSGKLVVVLETQSQGFITDTIEQINNFEHVLSTALVYHHIEQLDSSEND